MSLLGTASGLGLLQAAAQAGVIYTMGQWNSSAFLLYIRTPPTKLAQFTKMLAA